MFHGRDPYQDEERLLWRVWIWTDGCFALPEGELQSTPGNSAGEVRADVLEKRLRRRRSSSEES